MEWRMSTLFLPWIWFVVLIAVHGPLRVIVRCVCHSFCQSVAVSRITHERVDGCRPNTVGAATGDPVEVIHFCYSSGSECKSRIVSRFP